MSDFLTITNETAPDLNPAGKGGNGGGKKPVDPRFWKPTIKNEKKEYQSYIRLLPRGINGLKNRLNPSVKVLTHYLKSDSAKVFRTIKCRKTAGSEEVCPICEAAWAIFNEGKKQNNEDLKDMGKSMLPKETHVINILVRNDIQNKDNNGQVKLWEHTQKLNETLFAPTKEEKADPNKVSLKKKEIFYPYSPKHGRDFLVVMTENPKNKYPTYDSSEWDKEYSDLAATEGEIMAILDKCHDLTEFVSNIPTIEEAAQKYSEFRAAVETKEAAQLLTGGTASASVALSGSSATAFKNVSSGNAQEYFQGGSVQNAPAPQSNPLASMEPVAPSMEDSIADDELPF